jgi:hypothetical protein
MLRRFEIGRWATACVLIVDLDDLFAGSLVAGLRLRGRLGFRCCVFPASHAAKVHRF